MRKEIFIGVGVLVIGTVFVFLLVLLLGYSHTQKIQVRMILPPLEEKGSSQVQQELAIPSTAESQDTDWASMPQSTEKAANLASRSESAAPSVVGSQTLESTSMPQPVPTADTPAQKTELAALPVTESQNIESASIPRSTENANTPAPKPGNSKLTRAKIAKRKSANKRRNVHRRTNSLALRPAYTDFIDSRDIPHKAARNELHTPNWMGGW